MTPTQDINALVENLCRVSRDQFVDPFKTLIWPDTLDAQQWCFAPELISLYGMPEYEQLPLDQQQRLSFYEAINFFSLNIHGEKALIGGLAKNLYARDDLEISSYLHRFLDEENKHMFYFGRFCSQYAGKIYPDRKFTLPQEFSPGEEEFLFFAKVMVFEEIVDYYNKSMAADARLAPIAREINRLHHIDESRHLAFGRSLAQWLFERYSARWPATVLANVRDYLGSYIGSVWREYYNPTVYQDAGLQDSYALQQRAFNRPEARVHRSNVSRRCIKHLLDARILIEEPLL